MKLGELEVWILSEGALKLDGGAVFGVIPRPVWEHRMPPDTSNRVTLGLNQLLVRGPGFVLLVDAGLGDKLTPRQREYHGIETLATWEDRLAPHGISVSDITHLVITHLHYDHVGGATRFTGDGKECVPVFPNARVFVQAGEWNDAVRPNERTRTSYLLHGILPLQENRHLELITGDIELLPGVQLKVTGGHTAHHQMLQLSGGGSRLAWPADLFPTSCHINATWQSAFDLFPLESLRARQKFLDQILNTKTVVIFNHDPMPRLCRVVGDIDEPQVVDA